MSANQGGQSSASPPQKGADAPIDVNKTAAGVTQDNASEEAQIAAMIKADEAKAEAAAAERATAKAKLKAESEAKKLAEAPRAEHYVVGPGSLRFGGETYKAGASIRLTSDDAEDLGDLVKAGKAPLPKAAIAKRVAGRYVVRGPGSVWFGNQQRTAGDVLELSAAEARSLGDAVHETA